MNYTKHLLVILFAIFIVACKSIEQELKLHLIEINKRKIANIDIGDWKISPPILEKDFLLFDIHKTKVDTLVNFRFEYIPQLDKYKNIEHYKTWPDHGQQKGYLTLFLEGVDTMYMYKTNRLSDVDKYFIVGEYYYQYKYNLLNNSQMIFFEANKDSLIKVRGNNLPALPSR